MGCASSRKNIVDKSQRNKRRIQESPQYIGNYQVVSPQFYPAQRHSQYALNQVVVFPNFDRNNNQIRRRQLNVEYQIPRNEESEYMSEQISQTLSQIEQNQRRRRIDSNRQQYYSQHEELQALFQLFRLLRTGNASNDRIHMMLFLRLLQILGSASESSGLDEQEISNLKKDVAKNSEITCSICQDSIEKDQQIIILICTHQFHPQCIKPWLEKSDKCPMCRQSVRRSD